MARTLLSCVLIRRKVAIFPNMKKAEISLEIARNTDTTVRLTHIRLGTDALQ